MRDWTATAEAYDRSFATLCDGTAARLLADLPDGQLLDVGCGTGRLALQAEQSGRTVTALDADESMVEAARRRLRRTVLRAALPDLPLAGSSASAMTANFVINHVGRPRAALAELRRVLRPDGRLAMTIWPAGGASWSALLGELFEEAGAVLPPPERLPAGEDFTRSPDGLAGLARESRLEVLRACELHWDWRIRPEDLWAGIDAGIATPGAVVRAQTPRVRDRIREAFAARTGDLADADGHLSFPVRAAYVVAARRLNEKD
ncbi:class I SAM-dependent methyltransferase [Brachybacterium saurashtrense]|uniref:Class I SAM-dependent methyltransferase n=1 Tax=Brachybacterium saurashtrense TaxID=556288 RepID=A0AA93AVF4_9MICO|nr:class I SAM-dependent methyltransferase [Brachybacterium saurashtrense]RRR24263.1 class I SAM-dependent methyltransferase [Brachybacterium saurashtrense]